MAREPEVQAFSPDRPSPILYTSIPISRNLNDRTEGKDSGIRRNRAVVRADTTGRLSDNLPRAPVNPLADNGGAQSEPAPLPVAALPAVAVSGHLIDIGIGADPAGRTDTIGETSAKGKKEGQEERASPYPRPKKLLPPIHKRENSKKRGDSAMKMRG